MKSYLCDEFAVEGGRGVGYAQQPHGVAGYSLDIGLDIADRNKADSTNSVA